MSKFRVNQLIINNIVECKQPEALDGVNERSAVKRPCVCDQ